MPSWQASIQWPLPEQAVTQASDASGPAPDRRISNTPEATDLLSETSSPTASGIGQTSTQRPHWVQLTRMSAARAAKDVLKSNAFFPVTSPSTENGKV